MAKVLIVEDNEDVRTLVARLLGKEGHRVLGAQGGTEALALIEEKGAPDVVVLDVNMPEINGFDLLGRLREETGVADLPAIFLSGRVQAEDIATGRALGATYLTKPFVRTALISAIDAALNAQAAAMGETPLGW